MGGPPSYIEVLTYSSPSRYPTTGLLGGLRALAGIAGDTPDQPESQAADASLSVDDVDSSWSVKRATSM
jgi:hypothetical protein